MGDFPEGFSLLHLVLQEVSKEKYGLMLLRISEEGAEDE